MKSLLLAFASTLAFTFPAISSDSANIWLVNNCNEGLYWRAEWYNKNIQTWEYDMGFIPAYSEATVPTFTIWGSHDFYMQGKSENWTWNNDYAHTQQHMDFAYNFWCE